MDPDTFQQLPLQMDPQTKIISSSSADAKLEEELAALNDLHKTLQKANAPNQIPPPPVPVDPKRSAQIQKMKDAGNLNFKKSQWAEAIRAYSLAIEMAATRPVWEPSGLVREELSGLYSNRAQAHMGLNNWPEAAIDAQCSVELKRPKNAKAWWRRGKCLLEMGRLEEAKEWVAEGVEIEADQELVALQEEVERRLFRNVISMSKQWSKNWELANPATMWLAALIPEPVNGYAQALEAALDGASDDRGRPRQQGKVRRVRIKAKL